jgi:release factor glutamine methyltransferase
MMPTLCALHRHARRTLADAGIADAAFDARLIVEHFSGTTQADAIARPDMAIEQPAITLIEDAVRRRIAGESVHRIFGHREFYGLRLLLSRETLEPRPDTEILVEAVLPFVRAAAASHGDCRIIDLGTGTGAIALALLAEVKNATALGVDVSRDALATAARNAHALGLAPRFATLHSDWFSTVNGRFHAIVSNPPYIRMADIAGLRPEVREHDPWTALSGGEDGLDAYRRIAQHARDHLEPGGIVGVEIGYDQKDAVTRIFQDCDWRLADARRDFGGRDRVLIFAARP